MKIFEMKEFAKNSLEGKFFEIFKLLLVFLLFEGGLLFIINTFVEEIGARLVLSYITSFVIIRFFYFGYYSFFLKISRNENVTYKELFKRVDMFWTCIVLSWLISLFISFWTMIFIIPGIIASIGCSMSYFVALDNPDLDLIECIVKSIKIMKGHKLKYLFLIFSFLGWMILGIFTFGILYLWLIPYMQVTISNFYNDIKE